MQLHYSKGCMVFSPETPSEGFDLGQIIDQLRNEGLDWGEVSCEGGEIVWKVPLRMRPGPKKGEPRKQKTETPEQPAEEPAQELSAVAE